MRRFVTSELRRFLRALDRHLNEPVAVVMIGGAAAALAYRVRFATKDIDTMTDTRPLRVACDLARQETGLAIPFGPAGVADGPYSFEDRLRAVRIAGLRHLQVLVPEKHDLVLMKTVRGYEHDLETAEEIHRRVGLSFRTLIERFQNEMGHVVGPPERLRLNLLACIERVFGEARSTEAEVRLRSASQVGVGTLPRWRIARARSRRQ
jgi:hypothetical protein